MKKIIPHIAIILSVMFLVFYVLDYFNDAMNFIANTISKNLLPVLCVSSFATSVMAIGMQRKG